MLNYFVIIIIYLYLHHKQLKPLKMIEQLELLSESLKAKRREAILKCQQSQTITDVSNWAGKSDGLAEAILEVQALISKLLIQA